MKKLLIALLILMVATVSRADGVYLQTAAPNATFILLSVTFADTGETLEIDKEDIDKMAEHQLLRLAVFMPLAAHGFALGDNWQWYYEYAKKYFPEYFKKEPRP